MICIQHIELFLYLQMYFLLLGHLCLLLGTHGGQALTLPQILGDRDTVFLNDCFQRDGSHVLENVSVLGCKASKKL